MIKDSIFVKNTVENIAENNIPPNEPNISSSTPQSTELPPSPRALDSLPPEILLNIFSRINLQDSCRLSQMSKILNKLADDDSLWKVYLRKPKKITDEKNTDGQKTLSKKDTFLNDVFAVDPKYLHLHPKVKNFTESLHLSACRPETIAERLKYIACNANDFEKNFHYF